MRRRDFITLLGGAAVAWPLAARAQQAAMPVIGFLSTGAPGEDTHLLGAFHEGLKETGFIDRQNVVMEYHLAGTNTTGCRHGRGLGLAWGGGNHCRGEPLCAGC